MQQVNTILEDPGDNHRILQKEHQPMTNAQQLANVHGMITVDGKAHKIEGHDMQFRVEYESPTAQGTRGAIMGTQISESFSLSGGTLVTSVTIKSDNRTTTTTTTSDESGTTTTTTTTDGDGNTTTTIKINGK